MAQTKQTTVPAPLPVGTSVEILPCRNGDLDGAGARGWIARHCADGDVEIDHGNGRGCFVPHWRVRPV